MYRWAVESIQGHYRKQGEAMKYELIQKDALDEALENILQATQRLTKNIPIDKEYQLLLSRAYNTIQNNRTQCNVRPEDGK